MQDDLDASENFTFEQTNFNLAIGLLDSETDVSVYDEKYMNLTASVFMVDRMNGTQEKISLALRGCTKEDFEEFFPDLNASEDPKIFEMFCIDDPASIVFSGNVKLKVM